MSKINTNDNLVETSVLCDSKTSVRNQICFCCIHSPDMQDSFFSFLFFFFFFSFVKHKFIGLYRFINSINSIFKNSSRCSWRARGENKFCNKIYMLHRFHQDMLPISHHIRPLLHLASFQEGHFGNKERERYNIDKG